MEAQERLQIVAVGEGFGQVWLPLPLLLDVVDDFVWVGAAYVSHVVVNLGEVFSDFQG
jgi:hypothetical protein